MKILGNRILVSKVDEPKKEGFQTVDVQDSFVYKGRVEQMGNKVTTKVPVCEADLVYINSFTGKVGDLILFAKYSPDTQEVDVEGQKMKIIKVEDVLAIL